jgi:two-component system nitrogen regulation response regulator NtrX
VSPSALEHLIAYQWPGNVRELKNVIERLVIMVSRDSIEVEDLPVALSATIEESSFEPFKDYPSLSSAREAFEAQFIARKLRATRGNVTKTAEALGIERSHLYRKMKALGIK